ncbi:MAG: serine/threonine protein kinase [Myxococcales bacterium]|nr:serine/threonine protein kinase [Myxococcales bacterium]
MKARFGRYVFLKKLAVGGMAEIFLARRLSFGGFAKFIVLKRLLPEHRGRRAYEQLFLTEARIAAVLNHPNIVSLHDLGKLDDAYFMAMEYVHGVSGAELMARAAQSRKPLPLGCTLRIVAGIADALHYCHTTLDLDDDPMRILHHDVSPHNVQISYEGEVKLLDFGVATRIGHPAPGGRRGKPAYMSPEAIEKRDLDHRSDLFSLGIVLYEMSLSRRLFKASTAKETMQRVRAALVKPPTEIDPDFPRSLETVLLKVLSRDRAARFPDGRAFAAALRQIAEELDLDLGQDAFSAYLQDLYAEEISQRRAELIALVAAAEPGRARERDDEADAPGESGEATTSIAGPATLSEQVAVPADDDDDEAPDGSVDASVEGLPGVAGDVEPEDSDMATMVRSVADLPFSVPPAAPTPQPMQPGDAPTPTPIPDVADVGDGELEMPAEPSTSSADLEGEGEEAVAYELPPGANDPDSDWDNHTMAAPLAAARRRLILVALIGLFVGVGAFFVGRNFDRFGVGRGTLFVESDPAGAKVFDGSRFLGLTPYLSEGAPVGTVFKLRVEREGYEPVSHTVSLLPERRHRTVTVKLHRIGGR